jgi:hypothetical protein
VYGACPPVTVAVTIPSQVVESIEFVGVINPPKFKHGLKFPAMTINVNVTEVPLLMNVTPYVPGQRFVTM